MNIAICDDTKADANSLRLLIERFLEEIDCDGQISIYESGDAFLSDFAAKQTSDVQIVFLDIYMPGTNGIDTARKIRETSNDITIIFTTTSKDHGLDGYSVDALQYLVKPVNYPELESSLEKCKEKFTGSLRVLKVLSDRLTVRAYLKDICYIECFGDASYVHTVNETIKTFSPLSELEKQLKSGAFLRTHRSFIVNMRYVKKIAKNDFILTNGSMVPIRKNDKLSIQQAYTDYVFAWTRGART